MELPREIGLHLRGDRPHGPARLRPDPAVATHEQASVDRRAAGAALESVGKTGELLTLLEEEPAGLLRSGGVGVRDQKRLARVLHVGSRRPPGCWSSPTPPDCSTSAARTGTSGCPPAPTTSGGSRTSPTAGPCWPPAGWAASGCPRWSASGTSPARRSTRSRPT
ncbi:hypothetical protein [Blastococcus brunescens]|uniref:Uncharacterized protein n=1 Tax=Blastococcus brunescens TaxID=1564165 RepID=A0ABZ1B4E7_9ACTN|nr:hypothetical protein [Blastococcus sp. BMG 8361]WRL64606.1 hypothetical protein U6N30_02045 [Blastococcus sp. BMG 8361]